MNNILVVCVGNICRSPVAEGLFKARLPGRKVWSAGISAMVGHGADPLAVEIARHQGIDISAHRAQQLTGWMCTHAELVLVMEAEHKRQLEHQYPLARGKIRRLGDFGPQGGFDVDDPYHRGRAAFEASYAAIVRGVDDWARRIANLA
jgi:protein-tyrosine phosphatase